MTQEPDWPAADANHLLGDLEKLSRAYHEEGYLFFRNVLDLDAVLNVKQGLVRVLQKQQLSKASESEAIWMGVGLDQIDDNALGN
jgi:hypothetical protein